MSDSEKYLNAYTKIPGVESNRSRFIFSKDTFQKQTTIGKPGKVIYYPKVPKCASRTVFSVFRKLAKLNNYEISSDDPLFDFESNFLEHEYIQTISQEEGPLLYSRQIHYINFTRHHQKSPIQINVIRDPLDRLISTYYYRIYGSNNQNKTVMKTCVNKTIDETVKELGNRLSTDITNTLHPCWSRESSQLIFFCDNLTICHEPSHYRLQQAIRALDEDFLVIGMTENILEFMEVLEYLLPSFFKGATVVFNKEGRKHEERTKTKIKPPINSNTRDILRNILNEDYEFYNMAKQRFNKLLNKIRNHY